MPLSHSEFMRLTFGSSPRARRSPATIRKPEWSGLRLRPAAKNPSPSERLRSSKAEGVLITNWAGSLLKMGSSTRASGGAIMSLSSNLLNDFARYLYLPRLRDNSVLAEAIAEGLSLISWMQDSFAYADGWDDQNQRYRGLQVGRRIRVSIDGGGLVVKPDTAAPQLAEEKKSRKRPNAASARVTSIPAAAKKKLRRTARRLKSRRAPGAFTAPSR